MTARLRLLLLLARPALLLVMGLFAMTGVAQGGAASDAVLTGRALAVVVAYLLFSVVVNDLSDVAIDRANLPGDPRRPLASGRATRVEFVAIAVTSAVVALVVAAFFGWLSLAVVAVGLAMSAGYSLRPVRLADRGAVASLAAPAGYVAVPYLTGLLAVRSSVTAQDLVLLGGLYAGFVGRILLKDFRDVRGDALFGKRTFLVRHGRRATCAVSAVCWVLGFATLAAVRERTPEITVAYVVHVLVALALLRALADDGGPRRDERLVAAVAIVGRGVILALVVHLGTRDAGWPRWGYALTLCSLATVMLGQAWTMARRGPRMRATMPRTWSTPEVATHQ